MREGTWQKYGGRMANGQRFDDTKLVCASWDYRFGTKIKVTNVANKKTCTVTVTDRGPAKRLYRMGRLLDLSQGAFSQIADLEQGIIRIKFEVIK